MGVPEEGVILVQSATAHVYVNATRFELWKGVLRERSSTFHSTASVVRTRTGSLPARPVLSQAKH